MNTLGCICEPQSFPSEQWSLLISIRTSVKSTIPPAKYADVVAPSEDGKKGYYKEDKFFFSFFF